MTRTNDTVPLGRAHTSIQHTTKKMTVLSVWLSDDMVLVVVDATPFNPTSEVVVVFAANFLKTFI
jgi:hypothetical protein